MINLSILSFNKIVTNLHKRFSYERPKKCFLRKNKKKEKKLQKLRIVSFRKNNTKEDINSLRL